MKTIRQYCGIRIAGILLFILIKPFVQTHKQLQDITIHIQWRWIIPSFGLLLLYRSGYTYPLATLLSGTTQKYVPFRDAFTLYHLANITRYLPGRIWGVIRLLSLSKRFGLSKTAVGGSLTLHVAIETTLGGLICPALLVSNHIRSTVTQFLLEAVSGHTAPFALIIMGGLAGILFFMLSTTSRIKKIRKTL